MTKEPSRSASPALPKPKARKSPSAKLTWNEAGVLEIEMTGDWDRLTLAAENCAVRSGLLSDASCLGSHGQRTDEGATAFALGFVDAMKPKDAAEALLLTQMAATHRATMMLARRLNHVETIQQQDAAERALNKLGRTYAAQMDTLKRYRSKGQQTVRVERVTVENGGQAIVGNVETGGRGDDDNRSQPSG